MNNIDQLILKLREKYEIGLSTVLPGEILIINRKGDEYKSLRVNVNDINFDDIRFMLYVDEHLKFEEDNTRDKIELLISLRNMFVRGEKERELLLEVIEMLEGK